MKKRTCIALVLCLILSLFPAQLQPDVAEAASGAKLSQSSVTFKKVPASKIIKIKNVDSNKIASLSFNNKDANVALVSFVSKTKFKVVACGQGETKVTLKVKVKKKKKKYTTYTLKLKVYVNLPSETATPTPTGTATPIPTVTPTVKPTKTPSASPTASTKPSGSPSASPTVSPSGTPTVKPTLTPSASPTVKPTSVPTGFVPVSAEENQARDIMLALKATYPERMHWSDADNYIDWYAFCHEPYNIRYHATGCVAFACILSDAVFGECIEIDRSKGKYNIVAPASRVDDPNPYTIRIGDIIRIENGLHSAMVIGRDEREFTLAEGNIHYTDYSTGFDDHIIMWGRKIPITSAINYVWTRW